MSRGISTTAESVEAPDPNAGDHANPMHPGASKDKLTDTNSEPESPFGTKHDMIDFVDGDGERREERNTPVQVSLNAVGGTTGSDVNATGESVAEDETARNIATGKVMGTTTKTPNPDATGVLDRKEFKDSLDKPADEVGPDVDGDNTDKPSFTLGKKG